MDEFSRLFETTEASICIKLNQLKKRNITINGHRTSVTLENQIWDILHEIADQQGCSIHELCSFINNRKAEQSNLSSAIRVFLISYLFIKTKKTGE